MNKIVTSKEKILSVSIDIVIKSGIQGLNMRNVALECGVCVGSVYNYFPSKSDLIAQTIQAIWQDIFKPVLSPTPITNFTQCVRWIFNCVLESKDKYPNFFTMHSVGISLSQKQIPKNTMHEYILNIKATLINCLRADVNLNPLAFNNEFTLDDFVDFVFSNLLNLFMSKSNNCDMLIMVIKRIIY